jgi:hypothetical protein
MNRLRALLAMGLQAWLTKLMDWKERRRRANRKQDDA